MSLLRLQRVNALLKRELGEIVRRELPVDRVGLISVNVVEVSSDLKHATVRVSMLGTEDQKRRGLDILQEQRVRLQALVGRAVVMKQTPVLKFILDDSIEKGDRVLQIIQELEQEQTRDPDTP